MAKSFDIVYTEESYKLNHAQVTWQDDYHKPRQRPLEIVRKRMADGDIKLLIYGWNDHVDVWECQSSLISDVDRGNGDRMNPADDEAWTNARPDLLLNIPKRRR